MAQKEMKVLTDAEVMDVSYVWKTITKFHDVVQLPAFGLEDLEAAILCERPSSLIVEIHLTLLKLLLEDAKFAWENGLWTPPSLTGRGRLSLNLLKLGSWEELLGEYISYREGKLFATLVSEQQAAHPSLKDLIVSESKAYLDEKIWLEEARTVVGAILSHPLAVHFRKPAYEVNNSIDRERYLARVQNNPMDLGQIYQRICEGKYVQLNQIELDLKLTWDNAHSYFGDDSPQANAARSLQAKFQPIFATITDKIFRSLGNRSKSDAVALLQVSIPDGAEGNGGENNKLTPTSSPGRSPKPYTGKKRGRKPKRRGGVAAAKSATKGTPILAHIMQQQQKKRKRKGTDIANKKPRSENNESNNPNNNNNSDSESDDDDDDDDDDDMSVDGDDQGKVAKLGGDDISGAPVIIIRDDLVGIVDALLSGVGYEGLNTEQRCAALTYLVEKIVESERIRALLNYSADVVLDHLQELDDLAEGHMGEEYEHAKAAHQQQVAELERELKSHQRSEQRLRKSLLQMAEQRALQQGTASSGYRDNGVDDDVQTFCQELIGRSFFQYQLDGSIKVGVIDSIVEQKAKTPRRGGKKGGGGRKRGGKKSSAAEPDDMEEELKQEVLFKCVYDSGGQVLMDMFGVISCRLPTDYELGLDPDETPKRYFMIGIDDKNPGRIGDVVLCTYGFGEIEEFDLESKTYVISLVWGGRDMGRAKAYITSDDVYYLRVDIENMASTMRDRLEQQYKQELLQLKRVCADNPKIMHSSLAIENKITLERENQKFQPICAIGSFQVWSLGRMVVVENVRLETRIILRSLEALQMIANPDTDIAKFLKENGLMDDGDASSLTAHEFIQPLKRTANDTVSLITGKVLNTMEVPIDPSRYLYYEHMFTMANAQTPTIDKFLWDLIPALRRDEIFSRIEPLRWGLLRLEESVVVFAPESYRIGQGRARWLRKVRAYGMESLGTMFDLKILCDALLQIENELMRGIQVHESTIDGGGSNSSSSSSSVTEPPPCEKLISEKLEAKMNECLLLQKSLGRAKDLLANGKVHLETLLNKSTLDNEDEKDFVLNSLRAYHVGFSIPFRDTDLVSYLKWTRTNGFGKLSSTLTTRNDNKDFLSMFHDGMDGRMLDALKKKKEQENVGEALPQEEEELRAKKKKQDEDKERLAIARVVDCRVPKSAIGLIEAKFIQKFLLAWFSIREEWKALLKQHPISADDLMRAIVMLEQHVKILLGGLNFEICSQLFTCAEDAPPSYYNLKPGDMVVYDVARHSYTTKLEADEYVLTKRKLRKDAERDKFESFGRRGYSNLWASQGSITPIHGATARDLQVYALEFYPGGGEPYVAVTFGPKSEPAPAVRRPMEHQSDWVHGRSRLKGRPCKNLATGCRKYAIDGNFGYCEDHRTPNPIKDKEIKSKSGMDFVTEYVLPRPPPDGSKPPPTGKCFLCLQPIPQDGSAPPHCSCNHPKCPHSYHLACLKLDGQPDSSWECPIHALGLVDYSAEDQENGGNNNGTIATAVTPTGFHGGGEQVKSETMDLSGPDTSSSSDPGQPQQQQQQQQQEKVKMEESMVIQQDGEENVSSSKVIAMVNCLLLAALGKVCSLQGASPFLHPVREPGYELEIETPMCLQDMRLKALNQEYRNREQLLMDCRIIILNCRKWCKVRFPKLPPAADRLMKTMNNALKKISLDLERLESMVPGNENLVYTLYKDEGLSMRGAGGRGGRRQARPKRDAAIRARVAVASEVAVEQDMEDMTDHNEPNCGTCANCKFQALDIQTYGANFIRCINRKRIKGAMTQVNPREMLKMKDSIIPYWKHPVGTIFGYKDTGNHLSVAIIPLSTRFATFAMTTAGWQSLTDQETRDQQMQRAESARLAEFERIRRMKSAGAYPPQQVTAPQQYQHQQINAQHQLYQHQQQYHRPQQQQHGTLNQHQHQQQQQQQQQHHHHHQQQQQPHGNLHQHQQHHFQNQYRM